MEGNKSGKLLRTLCSAAVFAAGLGGTGALAQEDSEWGTFSADVTFASEYIFRGVSMSDEDPALQGSLVWTHNSGVYVGAWGSSGNFGVDGSLEVDWFAGYATEVSGVSLDFSVTYYTYPGDEADLNYFEVMAKAGYDLGLAAITAGVAYVPSGQDAYGDEDAVYLFSDLEIPIPNTSVTAGFHIGYEDFGGGVDKLDWSAGLYTTIAGINLGLAYVDTNRYNGGLSDARVLFTIGKSF